MVCVREEVRKRVVSTTLSLSHHNAERTEHTEHREHISCMAREGCVRVWEKKMW